MSIEKPKGPGKKLPPARSAKDLHTEQMALSILRSHGRLQCVLGIAAYELRQLGRFVGDLELQELLERAGAEASLMARRADDIHQLFAPPADPSSSGGEDWRDVLREIPRAS